MGWVLQVGENLHLASLRLVEHFHPQVSAVNFNTIFFSLEE
jgi:hypothetical protein